MNTSVQLTCEQCGADFSVPRSRPWRQRCCTRACCLMLRTKPLAERLLSKVNKDGPVPAHLPELGPCWVWTASVNKKGYGQISQLKAGLRLAHRVSWAVHVGQIPDGLSVLHKCDRPSCVRPDHLFLGTKADNNRDKVAKGRHAKSGHPGFKRGDAHWARAQPELVCRGEDVGNAKATEADVRKIREMAANGVRQNFIAEKLGLSRSLVSRVITGKTWAHVA